MLLSSSSLIYEFLKQQKQILAGQFTLRGVCYASKGKNWSASSGWQEIKVALFFSHHPAASWGRRSSAFLTSRPAEDHNRLHCQAVITVVQSYEKYISVKAWETRSTITTRLRYTTLSYHKEPAGGSSCCAFRESCKVVGFKLVRKVGVLFVLFFFSSKQLVLILLFINIHPLPPTQTQLSHLTASGNSASSPASCSR